MKRASTFAALLLVALLAPAAAAAPARLKGDWIRVRTKNFTIVSDAGEGKVRKLAAELEQFRHVLSLLFPKARIETPLPTTVYLFKTHDSFGPFKPQYKGKTRENVGGYFVPSADGNYIALSADARGGSPDEVIFHEYEHFVLDQNLAGAPPWLHEGLAEFYSTFSTSEDGRKVMVGSPITHHILALRQGYARLPLETLLAVDHKSPHYNETSKVGIFYAKSWALVHYLMLGEGGRRREQFVQFINRLGAGLTVEENFRQSFQADYKTIESELNGYVMKFLFPALAITLRDQPEYDKTAEAGRLSEAEAQFYLGDLLVQLNRQEEAERRLRKALELDRNLSAARVPLGVLRARQGRPAESLELLREAAAGDPSNYSARYHYGAVLASGGDYAAAAEEFRRAAELRPAGRAFLHLARSLEADGRATEAAEALTKGLVANERDMELFRARAYLYLRMGRNSAAASDALMYLRRKGWRDESGPYMALAAYFGLTRSRQAAPAAKLLEDAPSKLDTTQWPYPVFKYLRRELSADGLLKASTDNDKLTESHAYLGLSLAAAGDTEGALRHLRWVAAEGNRNFVEYGFALSELKRLEAPASAGSQ